uniref:Uncharacterized protein n=1 Tax=Rhodotorula toruloides TaxID=5286 RepID=A0A0K3CLN3_RHOTO
MDANSLDKSCTALDAAVRRYDTLNGWADFHDVSSRTSTSFDASLDILHPTWDHVLGRLEQRFCRAEEVKAEDIEGGTSGARMVVRVLQRTAGFADTKEVLECSVWLAALLGAVSNAALDIAESQRRSPSASPTPTPHDFFATRNSRTATPTPTPAPEAGPSGEKKKAFFAAVPPTPQSVPAKRRASRALDLDLEPVPYSLGGKGKGKARTIELNDEDDEIVFVSDMERRSRSCAPEVQPQPRVKREKKDEGEASLHADSGAGSPELGGAEGGGEQEEEEAQNDGDGEPSIAAEVLGKRARPPPGYHAGLDRSITPPAGGAEAFDARSPLRCSGKAAKSPTKMGKGAKKDEPDPSQPSLYSFCRPTHRQGTPRPWLKRS